MLLYNQLMIADRTNSHSVVPLSRHRLSSVCDVTYCG